MCRKDLGEKIANIEYAFQALYTLPEGVSVPDGRTYMVNNSSTSIQLDNSR